MSRDSIPVLTCDRCRQRLEIRGAQTNAGWGQIWASAPRREPDKPVRTLSNGDLRADLCAACADDLFAWWAAAPDNSTAEPPSPNPVPPAPTRARRRRLADIIDQALREQVDSSFGAIKLQPTCVLNEDVPAEALIGIDLRAQRLAEKIAKDLS